MITSFPRLIARAALLGLLILPASYVSAQVPMGSSARDIPTEVQNSDKRVTEVITRAEDYFRKGQLNLADSRREQARDDFDKAVDTILESGLDVRANSRLQYFYLKLIEDISRLEIPSPGVQAPDTGVALTSAVAQNTVQSGSNSTGGENPPQATRPAPAQGGFLREQKFEPSPLDDLAKLTLNDEETNVNPGDLAALDAAKNAVDFKFNTNPLIQGFINYYQGRGRSTMENGLRRSGKFMAMARKIFRQEGVPEDLIWLGQVESAWRPTAFSSAAASGLWQFVPSTGREFGLRQTAWVDERNSFEKATHASARYLKMLAGRYNGNWELAMAAYNTGAGNVDRAIARAGVADFWQIYPYIAQETRNYVPNILATILITKKPEKYGFPNVRPEPAASYDVVSVPNATSLQLIADATDTSVDYLRSINPELRRDITPRGEAYEVRIPAGRAKQFVALLKRVPGSARETARIISVAPGEDLQQVANRTGMSFAQLQALNGGDVKGTGKVVVPNTLVRNVALVRARPVQSESTNNNLQTVKARAGDNIARIAQRYNVSADDLARLNGIPADTELKAGQDIRVPAQAASSPSPAPRRRRR